MASEDRVNELNDEISWRQTRRVTLSNEIGELQAELDKLEISALFLPTEPGWYLTTQNTVALLLSDDDGDAWGDGWGNAWEDLDELVGAVRLIPETNPEVRTCG